MNKRISKILNNLGVPANVLGYRYLRDAIRLVVANDGILMPITKELYPAVAKINNTTASRVERAIRHAIEIADCNLYECNYKFYRNSHTGKPTNSNFIATIANDITMNYADDIDGEYEGPCGECLNDR